MGCYKEMNIEQMNPRLVELEMSLIGLDIEVCEKPEGEKSSLGKLDFRQLLRASLVTSRSLLSNSHDT